MVKTPSWLRAVFIIVMFCCVAVLIWSAVATGMVSGRLSEAKADLNRAKGNIRAHQSGFSTALDDILGYQDELDQIIPESIEGRMQADEYKVEINQLKAQRDQLKEELKKLIYGPVREKLPWQGSSADFPAEQEAHHE